MIFPPQKSLDDYLADLKAMRASYKEQARQATDEADKKRFRQMARILISADGARQYYADIRQNLSAPDMLTVEEVADRLGVTPPEYRRMAQADKALLFVLEPDLERVPAWSITADGQVDELVLDLAREYATNPLTAHDPLSRGFLSFMREERVTIRPEADSQVAQEALQRMGLAGIFNAAQPGASISIEVALPLTALVGAHQDNPGFRELLIEAFNNNLAGTGWDPGEGLSDSFLAKYGYRHPGPRDSRIEKVPGPR